MVRQDPRLSIAGPPSGPTHVLCPTAIDVFGRTRLGTIALADLVILCGDFVRAHEDFMCAWLTGLETSTQNARGADKCHSEENAPAGSVDVIHLSSPNPAFIQPQPESEGNSIRVVFERKVGENRCCDGAADAAYLVRLIDSRDLVGFYFAEEATDLATTSRRVHRGCRLRVCRTARWWHYVGEPGNRGADRDRQR